MGIDHKHSLPVLVTGGAGFIGSHVCDDLLAAGFAVRCMDDLSTGSLANIAHLEGRPGFSFMQGDIRDAAECAQAMAGAGSVVHLAALGSVPRSIADPLATEAANLTGFLVMLEACRSAGVKRFVYASSSSVYGDSTTLPKREGEEGQPLSPYAVTKAMDEAYAGLYHRLFGLETIGLRFFNVFGERQDPNGPYAAAIPRFVQAFLAHEAPKVHGDGLQSRDFTHVSNAVKAVRCGLSATDADAFGGVFNIAFGRRTTLLDLVALIREAIAAHDPQVRTVVVEHLPPRPGDVRDSHASVERSSRMLGFAPVCGLEEGLQRAVAWYRANAASVPGA